MSGGLGQLVSGIIGATIGFILGGPQGAALGWTLGTMVGGILWPMDGGRQEGPRLADRAVQTSAYGVAIPAVWGSYRLAGNIVWATDLVEVAETKTYGKTLFSKGTKVTTYTYFANCAVMLCRGPVSRISRIWMDGKLVYNPDTQVYKYGGDTLTHADGFTVGTANGGFSVYYGTETQMPNSAIEADKGAGQVPAFRGICYIVFHRLPVADYGNRIPVIHVEIGGVVTPIPESLIIGDQANYNIDNITYDPREAYPYGVNSSSSYLTKFVIADTSQVWQVNVEEIIKPHAMYAWGDLYGASSSGVWSLSPVINSLNGYIYLNHCGITGRNTASCWSGDGTLVWWRAYAGLAGGYRLALAGVYRLVIFDQIGDDFVILNSLTGEITTASTSPGTGAGGTTGTTWDATRGRLYVATDNAYLYALYPDGTVTLVTAASGLGVTETDFRPLYDQASDTLLLICDNKVYRLSPETFAVEGSAVLSVSVGGYNESYYANQVPENGTFWIFDGTRTASKVDIATLSVTSTCTLPLDVLSHTRAVTWYPHELGNVFLIAHGAPSRYVCGTGDASDTRTTLGEIISDICVSCALDATDIDVTDVAEQEVTGYCVARESTGRAAIEPLMAAFGVDGPETGGKIRFQFRKTAPDGTVDADDLGAAGEGQSEIVRVIEQRRQEIELPLALVIKYASQALDYQQAAQQHKRISSTVEAGDPQTMELPIVLTDAQAKAMAARILFLAWIERTSFRFALPPRMLKYDPGDVLDISLASLSFMTTLGSETADIGARILIRGIEFGGDGVVQIEALATDALTYVPPPDPPGIVTLPAQEVSAPETMTPLVLDAPLLDDADDSFGYYVGGYGESADWPGGVLYASKDDVVYEDSLTIALPAHTATTVTALPAHTSALIDRTNTLRLSFPYAVTLDSISELDLLAGGNRLLVGDELIGFATAVALSEQTWDVSVLLRGQQGTEQSATRAAGASATLTGNLLGVETAISELGQTRYFKGLSLYSYLDDATALAFAGMGIRLKPLSPVYIAGERDGSNNLTLTWTRRARVDADWRDYVETPLDEPVEAYEVDVMDGSSVIRTLSSGAASVVYSAADQVTDGRTPGDPVTVRIHQISTRVGRGYPGEATV